MTNFLQCFENGSKYAYNNTTKLVNMSCQQRLLFSVVLTALLVVLRRCSDAMKKHRMRLVLHTSEPCCLIQFVNTYLPRSAYSTPSLETGIQEKGWAENMQEFSAQFSMENQLPKYEGSFTACTFS